MMKKMLRHPALNVYYFNFNFNLKYYYNNINKLIYKW